MTFTEGVTFMLKTINQRISMILIILAVCYLILSYQIPSFPYSPVDADAIPKGLGWLLIVLAIFLYFSKDQESVEQKEKRNIPKKELFVIGTVFGFIFIYVFLFELIGFIIMTSLFVFICSWYLGYKKHVTNVFVSIGFSLFMYTVFTVLLKIKLPSGIVPF